jgi:hypothetical protein
MGRGVALRIGVSAGRFVSLFLEKFIQILASL